ncbi:hypothetical protein BKK52_01150 [Rodentibacter trehalosifermentans]|uniref:Peptidase M41 domain-containing protein n=1 Tax=Rodentibacter trehalosifermentans TaxID=1908263 RepID=A0A1V3J6B4_9PAST|nr:hypothetical protein [Rodentibacter trehalosifermentans]OOF50785.1 hypothetical protein BKK52_01150 [Rodentibacter trehalosifermentans]
MFGISLSSNPIRTIFSFIRQLIFMMANALFLALAIYGIFWFYLLLPTDFDTTLAQLIEIKPNTPEYRRFFSDLYSFSLSFGVFFVLAEKVVRFVCGIFSPKSNEQGRLPSGVSVIHRKMTPQDIRYVGAHEAGHLLVYGALGQLPPYMKVEVKEHTDSTTSLGYVSAFTSKRVTQSRLFIEWQMLASLAGREGESILLQDNSLGSIYDNHEWFELARLYLKNHFKGIFYIEPLSEFEFNANEAKLNALKEKQTQLLQAFFSLNLSVYKQLTSMLIEKKILYGHEIIPFFQQADITFPQGFPFPFGRFEKFSDEWHLEEEYGGVGDIVDKILEQK